MDPIPLLGQRIRCTLHIPTPPVDKVPGDPPPPSQAAPPPPQSPSQHLPHPPVVSIDALLILSLSSCNQC